MMLANGRRDLCCTYSSYVILKGDVPSEIHSCNKPVLDLLEKGTLAMECVFFAVAVLRREVVHGFVTLLFEAARTETFHRETFC